MKSFVVVLLLVTLCLFCLPPASADTFRLGNPQLVPSGTGAPGGTFPARICKKNTAAVSSSRFITKIVTLNFAPLLLCAIFGPLGLWASDGAKISADQLVAKHLESISATRWRLATHLGLRLCRGR